MQENKPYNTEVEEYEKWFITNDKLRASELAAIRKLLPTSGLGIEIGVVQEFLLRNWESNMA